MNRFIAVSALTVLLAACGQDDAGTQTTRAAGANERINVGLIGCGGRGPGVAEGMGSVQYVCGSYSGRQGRKAVLATLPTFPEVGSF